MTAFEFNMKVCLSYNYNIQEVIATSFFPVCQEWQYPIYIYIMLPSDMSMYLLGNFYRKNCKLVIWWKDNSEPVDTLPSNWVWYQRSNITQNWKIGWICEQLPVADTVLARWQDFVSPHATGNRKIPVGGFTAYILLISKQGVDFLFQTWLQAVVGLMEF